MNKNDKLYKNNSNIISKEYIENIISNLPDTYINIFKNKKFDSKEKLKTMKQALLKEHLIAMTYTFPIL